MDHVDVEEANLQRKRAKPSMAVNMRVPPPAYEFARECAKNRGISITRLIVGLLSAEAIKQGVQPIWEEG